MRHIDFTPHGVCSKKMSFDIDEGGIVRNIAFSKGCGGNLAGIAALCEGAKADELIPKLKDIRCGIRGTSCPAQFASALSNAMSNAVQNAVR